MFFHWVGCSTVSQVNGVGAFMQRRAGFNLLWENLVNGQDETIL